MHASRRPRKLALSYGLGVGAALVAAGWFPNSAADEVWFDNGRRLSGRVRVLGDGRVEVVAAVGRLVLPSERVARIERSESLEEAVQATLARLPAADTQGRFALATFCQARGAATLARQLLGQVLALDPDHQEAREALGFQLFRGQWLTPEQVHAARGEVRFRDRWVDPSERDRILSWETAQAVAAAEASRAEVRATELAAREARLAVAEERAREATQGFHWAPFCCAASPPVLLWPVPVPKPPHQPPVQPPPPRADRPVEHHRSRVAGPRGP